jgi:S-adenosylhomocysteine hydrolase
LKEKLNFDLPLVKIQGMALHPQKPILFCVTPDDRLLVIDTLSRAIVKEVRLKERVSRLEFEGMNPAVSPDGRLVAIANADGTISVFDFSE